MNPILLIEDEPMIAELYRTVLTVGKYDVITALNKRSAVELIEKLKPRLVLLDLMIPIGSGEDFIEYDHPVGLDVLEWIRHHPECQETKVIVITNLDSDDNKRMAEKLGAVLYLVKAGMEPRELVQHVDSVLGKE